MEELDLKEIFNMFWSKIAYIILIVILFSLIGVLYSYLYVEPKYKAYTTLLLATSNEDVDKMEKNTQQITTADITLNNNLVATYSELIKSKSVIRKVISNLRIDYEEETLKENISVSAVKSTQLIQIDVVDEDPYFAKIIANEVAKVFTDKVAEIYNINNVHVVDAAEEPDTPYNIKHVKDIALFAGIGFIISCIYIIISNMLDTTVKTKEDVERKLGLSVLVNIPTCNFDDLPKVTKKGGRRRE